MYYKSKFVVAVYDLEVKYTICRTSMFFSFSLSSINKLIEQK